MFINNKSTSKFYNIIKWFVENFNAVGDVTHIKQ